MKRMWFLYSLIAVFLVFGITFLFLARPANSSQFIVSPLPSFLNKTENVQVSTMNLFLPSIQQVEAKEISNSDFTAKSIIMYDLANKNTLYAKNAKEKLPMASLTKIMTAIVAMENKRGDNRYKVYKENLVGENAMGVREGEVFTLEELLYGLLLPSGNDAAEVLASHYPGGREEFILAMNMKVRSLGLSDTHFTNPSGLQGDGNQYSTAYDLLVITTYALQNFPLFKQIVSTFEYEIPATLTHQAYTLYNQTNLVSSYPGVKGVKTGFTPEAGLCLVTYFDYGGYELVGVILGSQNRRSEMKKLLDFSLKQYGITPPAMKLAQS